MMPKITCIVDNTARRGSPFWGEHGLSFHIETDQGCALLDTGRSEAVFLHNLGLLGKHPRDVDALILSHAHYDHTGAVDVVLSLHPGLPLFASPEILRPRFSRREGKYKFIGLSLSREELDQRADLHLSATPMEVLPGVWTTGEISQRPEPQGRSEHHFVPDGDGWRPDPYQDDISVVVETEKGLIVVCGCCHAGLLNTLAHVARTFHRPIVAILGGTHLLDAEEAYLHHVANVLRDTYGAPDLYLNHCTGERAYAILANALGDQVHPCPAGTAWPF